MNLYTSNENFIQTIDEMNAMRNETNQNIIYANKNINIKKVKDPTDNNTYILLSGYLDNNYNLYIRMPISFFDSRKRKNIKYILILNWSNYISNCRNINHVYFKKIYRAYTRAK